MGTKIINRRATLFVGGEPIDINDTSLPIFIDMFTVLGLFPSVNNGLALKITSQGIVQEKVISLDMRYLDDTFKVSIGPNRFDIICTENAEPFNDFLKRVEDVSRVVSEKFCNPLTRIALCSTVVFNLDASLLNSVYEKVTKNNEEQPIEWQIRKVLRTQIEDLVINNVYTLSRNIIQIGTEPASDCILLDIDINTFIGNDNNVLKLHQSEFWRKAISTIENSIDHYKN